MCKQAGAVITWKNTPFPLQNRYRLRKEECNKTGNTGVLDLQHGHWISHKNLVLKVSDNTGKLQIPWCETWVRSSLWGHCEVSVTFQFEVTTSSYWNLSMRFVWDHCHVMVTSNCWLSQDSSTVLFNYTVTGLGMHSYTTSRQLLMYCHRAWVQSCTTFDALSWTWGHSYGTDGALSQGWDFTAAQEACNTLSQGFSSFLPTTFNTYLDTFVYILPEPWIHSRTHIETITHDQ